MKTLLVRLSDWLTTRSEAVLDGLDDPEARRDCPGAACAGTDEQSDQKPDTHSKKAILSRPASR